MFSWIVDHASTLYWLLIFAALGFVAAWYLTKRAKFLAYAGAVGGVMALLFLLTRIVVSDRQQIENHLRTMAGFVVEGKSNRLAQHLAKDFLLQGRDREAVARAVVDAARRFDVRNIHLFDFDCKELDRDQGRAKMEFKVRVDGGGDTWGLVHAKSTFVREENKWKLRDIAFHRIGANQPPLDIPLR